MLTLSTFYPFHGTFQGHHFSSNEPSSMIFPNSPSCERFKDFISHTILDRVSNDERFLYCWIKDCPFTLDYITDLPGTSFLDISRHLSMTRVAMTTCVSTPPAPHFLAYYGTGGILCLLPHHVVGKPALLDTTAATNYIRSLGVPCSQYIDDRHCGSFICRPHNLPTTLVLL